MPNPTDGNPIPIALAYESPASPDVRRRPRWVIVVAAVYGLIVLGLAAIPILQTALSGDRVWWPVVAFATLLVAAEIGLLATPIRLCRRRPISRRSLVVPIATTGALLSGLAIGAGMAIHEWARLPDFPGWLILLITLSLWGGWSLVFWALSSRQDPATWGSRLHRWIYAGSVLELLIAVPAHVVCRRRTECCAGMESGLGMCIGIAVMLLAFGPSIALLYRDRCRRITPVLPAA